MKTYNNKKYSITLTKGNAFRYKVILTINSNSIEFEKDFMFEVIETLVKHISSVYKVNKKRLERKLFSLANSNRWYL